MKCRFLFYRRNPEKHPLWRGGRYKDSFGYICITIYENGNKLRIREHRYLMEKHIGRKLDKNEHVHHLNGIKNDNRIENLVVLNAGEHHSAHYDEKKMLPVFIENVRKEKEMWKKFIKKNWSINHRRCISCKAKKIKHQGNGLCRKCY